MSRWFIIRSKNQDLLDALGSHEPAALLSELRARLASTAHPWIEGRAYRIAGLAVRHEAAEWIRERARTPSADTFTDLAFAISQCLPIVEGFNLVTTKLAIMSKKDAVFFEAALSAFRSEQTLDWIELNLFPPVVESWGRLAALSQFDWARAVKWLKQGRPLSLAALDALNSCWFYNTIPLKEGKPKLLRPGGKSEMIRELRSYAARDDKPRPVKSVLSAIEHLEEIIS